MSTTNPPVDTEHSTTESAPALELPPLVPMRIPSGPAFPGFVYRFVDKLFRLDQAH
jgi:hypothetical protein